MPRSLERVQCLPAVSRPMSYPARAAPAGLHIWIMRRSAPQPPVREASDIFLRPFLSISGGLFLSVRCRQSCPAAPLLDFFHLHLRWRTMHAVSLPAPALVLNSSPIRFLRFSSTSRPPAAPLQCAGSPKPKPMPPADRLCARICPPAHSSDRVPIHQWAPSPPSSV